MSNLVLNSGRNLTFLKIVRRLSSFNNNRTKSGIVSFLNNEDSLLNETRWSEFGKQFFKSSDFSLPGQVGVILETKPYKKIDTNKLALEEKKNSNINIAYENLNFLLSNPLPQENQIIKLKEAAGGIFYQEQMEKDLFSSENSKFKFELKAFECPKSLLKDFINYFQTNSLNTSSLTVITLSFKTENDMANWNSDVESERELLIKKFVDTAQGICISLGEKGLWADYIDPSSGRPFKSSYTYATFYETDERYRQLGFEIIDNGCCKIISHHKWGTKTFVGCVLTNASYDGKIIKEMIEKNDY